MTAATPGPPPRDRSLLALVDAHFVGNGPYPLQLVCWTEDASDVECDTEITEVEPGVTWDELEARIVAHAAECHAAARAQTSLTLPDTTPQPAPELTRVFQGQPPRADGITTSVSGAQPAPDLAALRDFYWHEMDTLESGKPGYSYISDASLDKLEELFTAALPDALGVQPAPELAAAMAAMAALAKVAEGHERVMYAALIDVTHGDPNDALELLNEQLDGFDGPQWNGTETGLEWLERTHDGPKS